MNENHLREGNSEDGFFVEEIMRKLEFSVPENYNGVTVKGFLKSYCQISARMLAKLKRVPKGITADGKLMIATDHLTTGQKVILQLPEDEPYLLLPKDVPAPKVLWEDHDFLAVDKPAGQILYRRPGHEERDTLMENLPPFGHCIDWIKIRPELFFLRKMHMQRLLQSAKFIRFIMQFVKEFYPIAEQ